MFPKYNRHEISSGRTFRLKLSKVRNGMRRAALILLAWTAALAAGPALAADCPGNPGALGVSRTIVVDPTEHTRLGGLQYHESLPLNDREVVLTFDDGPLPPSTSTAFSTCWRRNA